MSSPLVHCAACGREWHSATMAEGLRAVGNCPRCGGTLDFADAAPNAGSEKHEPPGDATTAPHQVLGLPRR